MSKDKGRAQAVRFERKQKHAKKVRIDYRALSAELKGDNR